MKTRSFFLVLVLAVSSTLSFGQQRSEVTISLNEPFFDSLIDAIFLNSPPPVFPLSKLETGASARTAMNAFAGGPSAPCADAVTLLRENKSTRTAVRLRDGRINATVAFSGNYSPPLMGCIDFSGVADTNIELQFDRGSQKLMGRVRVNNVNLDGTGGIGGPLVGRMVQSSIDKKLNPIEIIALDKLSFPFTLPNSARLRMKASNVRHDVVAGALNIVISYEFVKD